MFDFAYANVVGDITACNVPALLAGCAPDEGFIGDNYPHRCKRGFVPEVFRREHGYSTVLSTEMRFEVPNYFLKKLHFALNSYGIFIHGAV